MNVLSVLGGGLVRQAASPLPIATRHARDTVFSSYLEPAMKEWTALLLASMCAVAVSGAAAAAESEAAQPATTPRVGGSPADAEFRAVIQKSGDDFRAAKADCRSRPAAERNACLKEASDVLKKVRAEARATHEQAKKAGRVAK